MTRPASRTSWPGLCSCLLPGLTTGLRDAVKPKADYILDVRGNISPFSLLKVSLVFQQMKPHQVIEVLGCDVEMQQDLLRLLPEACLEGVSGPAGPGTERHKSVRFRKEIR